MDDRHLERGWELASPFYDNGIGNRTAIGLIELAVDRAFMSDFLTFVQPAEGVGVFSTRIPMAPVATPDSLGALQKHLTGAVDLLVPGTHLDIVGFACTSGTVACGVDSVRQAIQSVRPGVATATPVESGVKAMRALNVRRISLLVPYHRPAADLVLSYFEDEGLAVDSRMTFDLDGDADMNALSAKALLEAGKQAMRESSDALFISCTGLRTAGVIEALEMELGRPVITSNQALAWDCLRQSGVMDKLQGRGVLFSL